MSFRFSWILQLLLVAVISMVVLSVLAFAQDVGIPIPADDPPGWVPIVIGLLGTVASASFVSMFVSSGHWGMKIVDALALNWMKARNDPKLQ